MNMGMAAVIVLLGAARADRGVNRVTEGLVLFLLLPHPHQPRPLGVNGRDFDAPEVTIVTAAVMAIAAKKVQSAAPRCERGAVTGGGGRQG